MPINDAAERSMEYDLQALQLISRVFDVMWREVDTSSMPLPEQTSLRVRMKQHLLEAAETGETDPDQLRQLALERMEESPRDEP